MIIFEEQFMQLIEWLNCKVWHWLFMYYTDNV